MSSVVVSVCLLDCKRESNVMTIRTLSLDKQTTDLLLLVSLYLEVSNTCRSTYHPLKPAYIRRARI